MIFGTRWYWSGTLNSWIGISPQEYERDFNDDVSLLKEETTGFYCPDSIKQA